MSTPGDPPHLSSSGATNNSSAKVAGIPVLTPPGPNTNFLSWCYVVRGYLASIDLSYVLDPTEPKNRPATWAKDTSTVSSFIARTINELNIRFIMELGTDTPAIWAALHEAHQDSSAGGRMYWLRRLVTTKMTGDDIESHIDDMSSNSERLTTLITKSKPLTVADIHATGLINSLPVDWQPCISSLMNDDVVSPARIAAALKQESLRRKACREEETALVSAAKASAPDSTSSRPPFDEKLYCTVCKIQGHNVLVCERAAKILTNHNNSRRPTGDSYSRSEQPHRDRSSRRSHGGSDKGRSNNGSRYSNKDSHSSRAPAKAGLTTVVDLNEDSSEDSDYSGSEYARNATVSTDTTSCGLARADANLDSGCSVSMTPHSSNVRHLKSDSTPVHLADHSVVSATQAGFLTLPLSVDRQVKSLVVPGLREPLLLIAGLCNKSLQVVFTPTSCDIYDAANFQALGSLVSRDYRKGNLYYLPSNEALKL
ncbi:hypothetical protein PSHT_12030 [Puccinia striiformis]|uniref:Retrotransposon Copia-like N-terminal domain-containing protein n=1 Tax=Puccinia striiformis TaxID=27350 RepID=A0A2S4UZE0_9BASI|nr:hypothetical protein PSHT_12030 [Puccinia striiformis]